MQQCLTTPPSVACGNCGTFAVVCDDSTGEWTVTDMCMNEGVCAPNQTETCNGTGTRACSDACVWSECRIPCEGASQQSCGGDCGTQTGDCDYATGKYVWSLCLPIDGAECIQGDTMTCQGASAVTCQPDCSFPACPPR